jgi:hypothetical protein
MTKDELRYSGAFPGRVQTRVRMDRTLYEKLEKSAAGAGRSVNYEIVRRLERSFEQRDHVLDGAGVGAELYKALALIASIHSRIYSALIRAVPVFHKNTDPDLEWFRNTITDASADLELAQRRITRVTEALLPADQELETARIGDDVIIRSRPIKGEEQ